MRKPISAACLALLGSTAPPLYAAGQAGASPSPDNPAMTQAPPAPASEAAGAAVRSARKPGDPRSDKPSDNAADNAADKPSDGLADKLPDNPADKPSAKPSSKPSAAQAAIGPDGKPVAQVTVTGGRLSDLDERRQSVAGKQVYGREELDRNGDTNLGDILKRLPGVTMGGRPGRGGEIRMRGLGSGYTQILVNGERPPAGFAFDSLAPDQVERIEVMRGPVAEHSTRAIAGTINIILRDGYQQRDNQLKVSDSVEQGRHSPNLSLTLPGKIGGLTYLWSGSVFQNRQSDDSQTHNQNVAADGSVQLDQLVRDQSARRASGLFLTPRLSYKFDGGDQLNFQPFLMSQRSKGSATSALDQSAGLPPPDYVTAAASSTSGSTFLRGFGNWLHKLDGAAKLDVRFGFGSGHSDSETRRNQYDASGALQDNIFVSNGTSDRSANTGGKYSAPLGQGHLLAAGWDAEWGRRNERQVSLDNNRPDFADSGDNLTAQTRRLAGFVQDEWDINAQWSGYLGLRWEGIQTKSAVAGTDVDNISKVWSPLAHAVWRIPGSEKDQIRASVTRSYRAPSLNDLIAAPSISRLNSATKPDRTGNPYLKPELATGLDMAYEHYFGRAGIVSVGGFVRNISDLMRRETSLQDTSTGPRWVSTPVNFAKARTSGIELEAKFQLADVMANAPAIDVRSNYSRFWSSVDGVPGPNNRLDQQARQSANLGADYRLKDVPMTLGAAYNWTPRTTVQTTLTQLVNSGAKRIVDVYGLWRFSAQTQLRISASNLKAADYDSGTVVTTGGLAQMAETVARTYTVWNIKLESKF